MARFVVDCGVVLRLAGEEIDVPSGHELLAPTLAVGPSPDGASRRNRGRGRRGAACTHPVMSIRLLGDAVLRRVAWKIADQLGWAETYDAEYLALTQLKPDAFVTLDAELARRGEGVVPTATIDALRTA
jgi:hypothetical protein